ncbi:MAG: head GIN domain-containing protein [Acidimicrobiia bacterium]
MNRRTAPMIAAGVLLTVSCGSILGVRGDGNFTSEPRQVADFIGVDLAGVGRVEIEIGDPASLTIEAEDNLLPLLTSDVSDGVLVLGTTENVNPTGDIVYSVTMPDVETLEVSGSGQIEVAGVSSDTVDLAVSGSGSVSLDDVTFERIGVDVGGSGSVTVSGTTTDLEVSISGSGSLDAEDLTADSARVEISGSGSVVVDVRENLSVDVSGSGSVEYLGSPTVESDISGSGSVAPR